MNSKVKELADQYTKLNIEELHLEKLLESGDKDLAIKRRLEDIKREKQEIDIKIKKIEME